MHYILDENKNIVPCGLEEWANFLDQYNSRRVALDHLPDVYISTVFIGLDMRYGLFPACSPILFETMAFCNQTGDEILQERYCTYEEAIEGHQRIVKQLSSIHLFLP